MKKIVMSIFILIIIIVAIKFFHYIILLNVYNSLNKFLQSENWYYSVKTDEKTSEFELKEYYKNNRLKVIGLSSNVYEIYDFEQQIKYIINDTDKEYYISSITLKNKNLFNLADLISHNTEKIKLKDIFDICVILPVLQENTIKLKIITFSDQIIVNCDDFLPTYTLWKSIKSKNNSFTKVKNSYEFKENVVTDDDVEIKNFEEYKLIND